MAVDPGDDTKLQNAQSWNKYAYVGNNPIAYFDPDGRFRKKDHVEVTFEVTGDEDLAQGVADVDNGFLGLPDATFNPDGHFGGSDKADMLLQKAIEAELAGEPKKADRLRRKAYHLAQDDIAHRDTDGRKIGWWEHLFRNIGDAFVVPGCKFSPDCPSRSDHGTKKEDAKKKTKEMDEKWRQKMKGSQFPDREEPKQISCNLPQTHFMVG